MKVSALNRLGATATGAPRKQEPTFTVRLSGNLSNRLGTVAATSGGRKQTVIRPKIIPTTRESLGIRNRLGPKVLKNRFEDEMEEEEDSTEEEELGDVDEDLGTVWDRLG